MLAVGTVVWLASELMFFSGLLAAYFTLRGLSKGPWPPAGVEFDTVPAALFTVALVASSASMQLAVRSLAAGNRRRFRTWVLLTLVLAAVFLANQLHEYATFTFSVDSHAYGSAFYLTTGFHGLHVGCPVGLYQEETHELLCPCHQSTFDVLDGARPVFGPATRSLPQLPLVVDPQGFLVAQRDYTEPVGPGFWNRR